MLMKILAIKGISPVIKHQIDDSYAECSCV